jgi:hypothetical protein
VTPGTRAIITRGARVEFRAVVERIAWPGRNIILGDVRTLDGRPVMTTGFTNPRPLVIRATGREGHLVGAGGYGGEQRVEVDEWDH